MKQFTITHRERSFYMDYVNKATPPYDMHHLHLHDDYEIFYLLRGSRIYVINESEFFVPAQHLVFINKQVPHKTKGARQPEHERMVVNFQPTFVPTEAAHFIRPLFEKGPHILAIPTGKQARLQRLMERMLEEYLLQHNDQQSYLQALLVELLIECERLLSKQPPTALSKHPTNTLNPDREIQRMISFITGHYMKPITIADIADHLQLPAATISKRFRQSSGYTITTYLNTVRIRKAQRLLQEETHPITRIAESVGFRNPAHFYRVFKHHTGLSPSAYRNQFRVGTIE